MDCLNSRWRRPYTFVVLSMLLFMLGVGSAVEAPKDIFPYINIPVVTIVWTYTGLTPTEMEGRIVTVCERALTTTVNDIEHTGVGVVPGCGDREGVLPAGCKGGAGGGAGDFDRADGSAGAAAGVVSPIHHQVRRVIGADSAAFAFGRKD